MYLANYFKSAFPNKFTDKYEEMIDDGKGFGRILNKIFRMSR